MLKMSQYYEPEFKKKIVRLHLEEGRSLKGLAEEYGVSKASISIWTKQFREECQTNDEAKADYDYMKENLQLKKQLAELQKENDFLKKAEAFICEGNRLGLSIDSEIQKRLWTRWLLRQSNICPNAYYNYLKNRTADFHQQKDDDQRFSRNLSFSWRS